MVYGASLKNAFKTNRVYFDIYITGYVQMPLKIYFLNKILTKDYSIQTLIAQCSSDYRRFQQEALTQSQSLHRQMFVKIIENRCSISISSVCIFTNSPVWV